MAAYRHPCNTPSCIAGFALAEAGGEAHDDWDVEKAAMQWLGLTHMQKVALFLAVNHDQQQIKPSEAARCLRHYAETGQVNWDLALGVKL